MDMLLRGKRALVTGSTSGIGAQCARVLAGEGVSVVINGRNAGRAEAIAKEVRDAGGTVAVALGDITTEEGAAAVAKGALEAFGGIDILVNNAGGNNRRIPPGSTPTSMNGSPIIVRMRWDRFE